MSHCSAGSLGGKGLCLLRVCLFNMGPDSLFPSALQGKAWARHQEVGMEACTCHSPEASLALVSECLDLQEASLNSLWGE